MEMQHVAQSLVASGKGILAADESNASANKRLAAIELDGTEENRQQYRDLFLGTPGIGAWMSGVILYDETMKQQTSEGEAFLDVLKQEDVLIGIKVDQGKVPDPHSFGETITIGLDSLPERLPTYYKMGARFAKWRAVLKVDETLPTVGNAHHEMQHLAHYARLCQDHGLVPMVEPEVLLDGNHTIERAAEVTQAALQVLFHELEKAEVDLKATILKTSMVLPGKKDPGGKDTPQQVAEETVRVLKEAVPASLAGVVFLSGGQEAVEATQNLNAISQLTAPWPTTFSYARAIQGPAMQVWKGKDENKEQAREVFLKRLELNALASVGKYSEDLET